ncbi:unnamed protein product [Hyaloperonospora brassicae]|uniref:RxLR effector candidate protein n=1 Tax=Hyaloperonospora brassicae TaxID=162125 RepID=A0AAV0TLA5_HYABA|nr:unnamed protein product [Hyaloperonospora brassicae]
MMPTVSRAVMSLALLSSVTRGINVYVTNKCDESMTLAHVTPSGVSTDQVSAGGSITKVMPIGTGSHVFKSGIGAQATLAEFSAQGEKCWLDISIIPTGDKKGPDYCTSLVHCKEYTGGVGFNVPMQITPHMQDGDRCIELTCLFDGCAQAYQFPLDDTKTHSCPLSTDFDLTFCPGGSGKEPMPPAVSPPAPPPTKMAPTLAPVEAPAPAPAPAPIVTEPLSTTSIPVVVPSPSTTPSTEQTAPAPDADESPDQEEQIEQEEQEEKEKEEEKKEDEKKEDEKKEEEKEGRNSEQVSRTFGSKTVVDGHKLRKVDNESVPQHKSGMEGSSQVHKPTAGKTAQQPTTNDKTQQIGGKTPLVVTNEKDENVQQVNNRSEESGTNHTPYVVLTIGGFVGMVAAAAIVVVRKKKAELDELETKTPLSSGAQGVLAGFRTPRDNISVL